MTCAFEIYNEYTVIHVLVKLSPKCPGHVPFPGFGHGQDFFGDTVDNWPVESHVMGVSLFLSHEWHLTTNHYFI